MQQHFILKGYPTPLYLTPFSNTFQRKGYPPLSPYTFHITLSHKSVVYLTSHSYLSSAYPHSVNQRLIDGLVIYLQSGGYWIETWGRYIGSFLKSGGFIFSSHTPHFLNTLSTLERDDGRLSDTGNRILDRILDRILEAGYSGHWILDSGAGCRWPDTGTGYLDAGGTGCRKYWKLEILDAGDSGCWRWLEMRATLL